MDRGAWQATVHGILQARILEWIAFPFSRRSSQPRGRTQVSFIAGNEDSLPAEQQGKSPTKALNPSSLDNIPLSIPSVQFSSVQFSSVAQSCLTLCDTMNPSTLGLPVHHQLPEFIQTHVHRVSDAIQPSHPRRPFLLLPAIPLGLYFSILGPTSLISPPGMFSMFLPICISKFYNS